MFTMLWDLIKDFKSLVPYSSNTILSTCLGAGSFRDGSSNVFNFASSQDTIYQLTSGAFADRGAGGLLLTTAKASCTITVSDYANNVSKINHKNTPTDDFVKTGSSIFGYNDDFNGEQQEGIGYYQTTQKNGKRCSAAKAYLVPIKDRDNLTVLTDTHVKEIITEGDTATGVECILHYFYTIWTICNC